MMWRLIHDLVPVEGDERDRQMAYLRRSDVRWVAEALQRGQLQLLRGEVRSRVFLGNQRTIFSDLGGIRAQARYGREKFLIENVYEVLNDPSCKDARSRGIVDSMIESLNRGRFAPNITIIRMAQALVGDDDPMLVDGNKSAVAFHHAKAARNDIELSVFVAENVP